MRVFKIVAIVLLGVWCGGCLDSSDSSSSPANVAGNWYSESGRIRITLDQFGNRIDGVIAIDHHRLPISGVVDGRSVAFRVLSGVRGQVAFDGKVSGNTMTLTGRFSDPPDIIGPETFRRQ